ncbi:MAG: SH3 domain-containing protein [Chloroflexi bacterium]|nr:SH3 domain-containing protein [Chloroflexota bacterium]
MSVAFPQVDSKFRPILATSEPPIHWPSAVVGLVLAVVVVVGVSWLAAPRRGDVRMASAAAAPVETVTPPAPTPIPAPPLQSEVRALLSQPAEPIAERVQVAFTNGSGVNVRAKPGERGQRLKTLREGSALEVVGADQTVDGATWRNVRDATGTSGWVSARYLATAGR